MQKEKPKKKRRVKKTEKGNRKVYLIAGLMACLLLVGVSITVYSKYYRTGYNQGMAIASGFYFSSSYMYEEEGLDNIKNIEELAKRKNGTLVHEELVNRLISSVSNETWNGNSYTFHIDVRNYANQLLYNDKDLSISYKVEFVLLDADTTSNGTYEVRKGNSGSYTKITNNGNGSIRKASFQGTLAGGQPLEDDYELRVTLTKGTADYVPARVLIMAYPEGIAFVQNPLKIAGIVRADYNQAEMQIIDQKFTIEDELESSSDWKKRVKEESAFVYQLKTTGGYYVEGNDNMMQTIKIKWDPDMFVLNQNDRYIKAKDTQYDPKTGEMIIKTVPYSSIKFVFFKKEGFDGKVDAMGSLNTFKTAVTVTKVETTEP